MSSVVFGGAHSSSDVSFGGRPALGGTTGKRRTCKGELAERLFLILMSVLRSNLLGKSSEDTSQCRKEPKNLHVLTEHLFYLSFSIYLTYDEWSNGHAL